MSAELPWYAPGLQFSCTGCGQCCTGGSGFVWVTEEDLAAIAEYLGRPLGEIRLLHTRFAQGKVSLREHPNGDCIYLDRNRRCMIYPIRPIQCRTWPFWEQAIRSEETWRQTCNVCPGAGTGTFVPWEEVAGQAASTGI